MILNFEFVRKYYKDVGLTASYDRGENYDLFEDIRNRAYT